MSLITIGVPTYNRKDIVYKTLMHLINSDLPVEDVEFLVSDNASEDGTFELLSIIKDDRLSLYQNESNIHLDGNIYAVFSKAKSPFILLMSDEDYVIVENIKK